MINKLYFRTYEVECDECGYTEIFEDINSFKNFIEEIKMVGWRAAYKDGEYEHYCSECVDEWKKEKQKE